MCLVRGAAYTGIHPGSPARDAYYAMWLMDIDAFFKSNTTEGPERQRYVGGGTLCPKIVTARNKMRLRRDMHRAKGVFVHVSRDVGFFPFQALRSDYNSQSRSDPHPSNGELCINY